MGTQPHLTSALRGLGPSLQDSTSCLSPNSLKLMATLDHSQIKDALTQFGIKEEDYYLLFDNNIIYMIWCTTGAKALRYLIEYSCISVDIKGQWFYYNELPELFAPPSFVCVKYILVAD